MDLKEFCYRGERPDLKKIPESAYKFGVVKEDKSTYVEKTEQNVIKIAKLQDKLFAEGREGVIVALQAMDAAGKDGTIKHVMSGVNPQGVHVVSFKQPTSKELSHDYLWRVNQALPERGKIAIFNRSHYEDVLVTQIHEMEKGYKMAERCFQDGSKKFYENRYKQIRNYEDYLYENSYRMVKIFLNVSKEEQKKRFLERINDEGKNWKFSKSDLEERKLWDEYHELYEEIIERTGTKHNPWFIVPADQKWYARYVVSEIIVKTLEDCEPEYPDIPEVEKMRLAECKKALEEESK